MGLFKKPNRKFRQREARPDSEDEGGTTESTESKKFVTKSDVKDKSVDTENSAVNPCSSSAGTSSKDREEKVESLPKATKLLSFHDEEDDGEVFKLKKSNYSRRLAKQREREKKKREENQIASVVTKEGDEKSKIEFSGSEAGAVNQNKDSWDVLTGNDAEDMEVESDDEKEKVNPFKNVLQSGVIPDAATIYAMKKHRQMAREMGDYIPIEESEKDEETKSRLIREDDNDRSDDDEDDEPSRLSFTVNTGAVERQKIRETFLSLQEGPTNELETEDAAELDRWEREQIRKGVGVTQVGPSQNATISDNELYSYQPVANAASYANESNQSNGSAIPQPFLNDLLKKSETHLTTYDIKARLEERLSTLKALHKAHQQELLDCGKEILEKTELIKKLEIEAPERAQNFSLYQQMSGYVKDLVECLDLKVAHIELLDNKMLQLYQNRAKKLLYRRQQDVRDQSDEYSTLSSEILKGVSAEFLSEKNNCTDESKLRRAAEREGRRMRRRKKRERVMVIVKHQDGMSTDDEEPDAEILQFKKTKEEIVIEANTIFEDVIEEFGTLEGVMLNFEKWKYGQLDSYREAFVPLCLPKIFGTFVRLALLDWNPLEEERDFEKTNWYRQLVCYGCSYIKNKEEETEDPDTYLLPGIIEKIVLPKITGFVQNVWDPLSQKETTKLIELVKSLHENYPTIHGKSKQLQACLKAVCTRIYKALDDDIFIPLYPKELLESRSLGAADFFQRQFWSSVKLLQNIVMWDGIVAEQPLQQMALASLVNRYLLMGLHTSIMMKDTLDKCKMIVSSLPKSWFKNSKASMLPLLKQFTAYLMKFADSHHVQNMKRSILEEETKDVIKEIVQLLVALESLDEAVSLAKKYSVSFKN